MLNVAICDDEKYMCAIIKKSLDDYAKQRCIDLRYDEFHSGREFLCSREKYDLLILDYEFRNENKTNGLEVARRIRVKDQDLAIIFLTSHPKVVFSSFEVDTFRFLVKPLENTQLTKALDDYLKTIDTDKKLVIRIDGVTIGINTKHIVFIEGNGKYCIIHTEKKQYECHETMGDIEKRLPAEFFFRCHRSFIVNMDYVGSYDNQSVILQNGTTVFVSRQKNKAFHSAYLDYTRRYTYA